MQIEIRNVQRLHSLMSKGTFIYQCLRYQELTEYDTLNHGPEVIKLFSCSTQLSMKFFLLINVKINIYELEK